MPKSCIPGLDEAFAEERRLREEIYLDAPHIICGVVVNQVTPRLLARLLQMRTPFLGGGPITDAECIRFLWAMSVDFDAKDTDKRDKFIEDLLVRTDGDFDSVVQEIDEFVEITLLDMPRGGAESTPYVSSIAWMEYAMAKEPFKWDSERTLNTPLRRIYQLLRCQKLENGAVLYNAKSDAVKATWLEDIRKAQPGGNN